ncbi:fibrinolytic enzyme, isozyme C-like [Ruditapes philippinarum]|uniref:fibrinolytic enzyme, isozyme C-like n=1 Tax=Ruditapes philippinarum TaxID=129788 RepID=UPI00295B6527|nr:fibrinolytic enzyme, isozyme C-like [Ruditapes philippinarum]
MLLYVVFFAVVAVVTSIENETRFLSDPLDKSSRIINGVEANKGEFPHQAALLNNGYHSCGASVIAQNWVITAAHCVDGRTAGQLAIVVNLHDYSNPGISGVDYIYFNVEQIIMHENYNTGSGAFPNDVAVLRLTPKAGVDISGNAIKLAEGSQTYAGQICTISGWGVKVDGTGASKLKKADVSVLSKSECVSYWGSRNILDQHVCVKGYDTTEGSGSCNGDSGGPLICGNVLVGVTSWGFSGCHQDGVVTHPSVYARVTTFYSWVNSKCGNCAA